jgi:hypothetical protein
VVDDGAALLACCAEDNEEVSHGGI